METTEYIKVTWPSSTYLHINSKTDLVFNLNSTIKCDLEFKLKQVLEAGQGEATSYLLRTLGEKNFGQNCEIFSRVFYSDLRNTY